MGMLHLLLLKLRGQLLRYNICLLIRDLETMHSSHPMFFAKKVAEVASDNPTDWMDQPPASLSIRGVLRSAFIEEHSVIQKHLTDNEGSGANINQVGEVVEDNSLGRVSINGYE